MNSSVPKNANQINSKKTTKTVSKLLDSNNKTKKYYHHKKTLSEPTRKTIHNFENFVKYKYFPKNKIDEYSKLQKRCHKLYVPIFNISKPNDPKLKSLETLRHQCSSKLDPQFVNKVAKKMKIYPLPERLIYQKEYLHNPRNHKQLLKMLMNNPIEKNRVQYKKLSFPNNNGDSYKTLFKKYKNNSVK